MKIFSTLPLLAGILATTTLVGDSPKGTTLRLDLPVNEKVAMVTEMKMEYFTDQALQEKMMSTDLTMHNHYMVSDKTAEGVHTVDYVISRIQMNQDMQGMTMNFDSDSEDQSNPMAAQIAAQFEPILNQPITLKVNRMGEVVEEASAPEGSEGMSGLANISDQLFIKFPEKELKKGDSWTSSQTTNAGGKDMSMDLVYTVSDLSGSKVILDFNVDPESIQMEGEEAPELKMSQKGSMTLDKKTGQMISANMNSLMEIESPQMGTIFMVNKVKISLQ